MTHNFHSDVDVAVENNAVQVKANNNSKFAKALSGTTCALLKNNIVGVSEGYQKKLDLIGIGYRAQVQDNNLNLTLGYSHPISFSIPEGIMIETPSQTEIIIKGIDKNLVSQVAANIRTWRTPEPYKGKGVRYSNEQIIMKEAKKA